MLVLLIIPLTMGIGLVGSFLLIYQPLGSLLLLATWPLLQWVIWISEKLAGLNFASTDLSLPSFAVLGMVGLTVAGLEYLQFKAPIKEDIFDRIARYAQS